MKCPPELLEEVKTAIESLNYGCVHIQVNERGSFYEITIERKIRHYKDPDKDLLIKH